jgi:hypothetical protein
MISTQAWKLPSRSAYAANWWHAPMGDLEQACALVGVLEQACYQHTSNKKQHQQ